MNLTNYHSHSTFCDGHASMEEFVIAAIKKGYSSYGFSSHAPLPYHTRWNMDSENLDSYIAEFHRLKEKYKEYIELYLGLEIDYLTADYNANSDLFKSLKLDYRIGSLHTVIAPNGDILEIDCKLEKFKTIVEHYFDGDIRQLTSLYIDRLMLMVETGGFDIVGHADKMHSLSEMLLPGISNEDWYIDRMKTYFNVIAQKGYIVEMNTKKYLEKHLFFPDASWYTYLNSLGVRIVVNSDSHSVDKISNGRMEGLKFLKSCGYDTVCELHNNIWVDTPII